MIGLPLAVAVLLLVGRFLFNEQGFSTLPRGDVAIDAAVAVSLTEGKGFWTPWERGTRYLPPEADEAFGFPADQHPPLWPAAGALIMGLLDCSSLRALEWASFLSHAAVLILMVLLGFKMGLGRLAVLPALAWCVMGVGSAFSFNGSLYMAQAALYLAAAWLMSERTIHPARAFVLGLVLAAAYLLNYQALLLVPAFLIKQAFTLRRELLKPIPLFSTVLALLVFAAAVLPWLLRNAALLPGPFYSVNAYYLLAKAGASFSHELVDNHLVLLTAPLGTIALLKGMAICAWQNIPFLLMLVMAAFPGCAAAWVAAGPSARRDPLIGTLGLILAIHLAACLLWPACKLRYLVPAGPLLLLPAWKMVLHSTGFRKKWIVITTAVLGLLCAAVWIKGSVNGQSLFTAFLLGYFSLSLLLLVRFPALPRIALMLLALSAAGTWPGAAYFNIAPWPDFTGEDKEAMEEIRARDLVEAARFMDKEGIDRLLGEIGIWHLMPEARLVTLPKKLPGEDYPRNLEIAAWPHSIRHALLPLDGEFHSNQPIWQGKTCKLIKINP